MQFNIDENGVLLSVECNDKQKIKSIKIPEGVKKIRKSCFRFFLDLQKIYLSDSVEIIGEYAFSECYNLTEIKLSKSLKIIESGAFDQCESLENIEMPNEIETIGEYAFYRCSKLRQIDLPPSLKKIGSGAFSNCTELKDLKIPQGISKIPFCAFYGCDNLEKIVIPPSVKIIMEDAFSRCTRLEEIQLTEGLEEISNSAFSFCKGLNKITIPSTVLHFGKNIFEQCENLEEIIYGNMIIKLGTFPSINLDMFFYNKEKLKELIKRADYFEKKGIIIPANEFKTYEDFINFTNKSFNKFAILLDKISQHIDRDNLWCLYKLANNMGLLENDDATIKINGKDVYVSDVAYEILQKAFKNKYLEFSDMYSRFSTMKLGQYNEEFLKFMAKKDNLVKLKEVGNDNNQLGFDSQIYEWFEKRKRLNISLENKDIRIPKEERNRYKIATYETADNGTDKLKWKRPTVEFLKKEFDGRKFSGVTKEYGSLAQYLSEFKLYEQKHFDKAVEIDKERKKLQRKRKIKDHLTKEIVKEELIDSIEDYIRRTKGLKEEVIEESIETIKNQADIASNIFTYEMLAKSDKANFAIGFLTDCCATLYGSGAGAQRAMIIHPDIQPLVIRDINENIVAFSIIYVNRKEGYAVLNDIEVSSEYYFEEEKNKEIYTKVLQSVNAFVEQYNKENKISINKVTCGVAPKYSLINKFISDNPQSEILKAPDFDDFKYAGSESWSGDWHREQYVVWSKEDKKEVKNDGR